MSWSFRSTVLVETFSLRGRSPGSTGPPAGASRRPQRRVLQPGEESRVVVGEAGDLFGGRLPAEDLARPASPSPSPPTRRADSPSTSPPAALLPRLVPHRVERLAHRDRRQQPPEVVPVVQLRELAPAGAIAEALEGAQGHVLLVERPPAMRRQPRAGQPDQPLEVAIPEPLDVRTVASLDPVDPDRDRILLGPRRQSPIEPSGKKSRHHPGIHCRSAARRTASGFQGFLVRLAERFGNGSPGR